MGGWLAISLAARGQDCDAHCVAKNIVQPIVLLIVGRRFIAFVTRVFILVRFLSR